MIGETREARKIRIAKNNDNRRKNGSKSEKSRGSRTRGKNSRKKVEKEVISESEYEDTDALDENGNAVVDASGKTVKIRKKI